MAESCKFLILQHVACEPPGIYEEVLLEHGAELVRVELDEGEAPPGDCTQFDGVVVMGGPMGTYEHDQHPWLLDELALIRSALDAKVPVWGVCLGAQLLAASLGEQVAPGETPEIGVLDVTATPAGVADRVFGQAPASFATLQWHSDTYTLPAGAQRLARSAQYPQQAFRIGNSYGLQFHIEVSADMLSDWAQLPAYASALERVHGPGSIDRLVQDWEAAAGAANLVARQMFEAWLSEFVGVADDPSLATSTSFR